MNQPVIGRIVSSFYKGYKGKPPKLYFAIRTPEGKKVFPKGISAPLPYFYCREEDLDKISEELTLKSIEHMVSPEPTLKFAMNEGNVYKVKVYAPWEVGGLKKHFRKLNIEIMEADILYERRVRIDKGIKNGILISNNQIFPYHGKLPRRRYLYIDIEIDDSKGFPETPGNYSILCIGTTNDEGEEKFFTWKFGSGTEKEMLEKFFDYATEYDELVMWNADFDKQHIIKRSKKLELQVEWRIFRWVDLAEFYRIYYQKTYWEQLPIAYKDTLKKYAGKLKELGIVKFEKIDRLAGYYTAWKTNPEELKRVNQSHSYALYVMEKAMELISVRAHVADEIGIFTEQTKWNSHIVNTLAMRYIKEKKLNYVINSSGEYSGKKGFRGAVVFPPKKGIFSFIYLFDFTSLYNRIIQGYLLDPITYYKWNKTFTEEGINAYVDFAREFAKKKGVEVEIKKGVFEKFPLFPAMLHELEKRRNAYKKERKKHPHGSSLYEEFDAKQKSMKVVLLACYGVLGMKSSRWAIERRIPERMMLVIPEGKEDEIEEDYRVPNKPFEKFVGMITHLAREALKSSKFFFEEDKMIEILYGDTDSDFIKPKDLIDETKTYKDLTEEDLKKLEDFGVKCTKKLEEFFSKNFQEGIEMKLEKIFDRGIFGDVRKQYYCRTIWDEDSGWQKDSEGNITWYEYTKGLPLVRSDRTKFLQIYQKETLNQMLNDPKKLYPMWARIINDYYNNKLDHMLILRIGVKKRLDEYEDETPNVQAARKLVERGEQFRPGEKVSFIVIDIDKNGKKVAEPVDFNLDSKEAIKHLPKLTKAALDYYWNDRLWNNIKPFLAMVLEEDEIRKIEFIKTGETSFSRFPGFK